MRKRITVVWNKKFLARVVSRSLADYVWGPLLLFLGFLKSGAMGEQAIFLMTLIFLQVGMPSFSFLYLFKKGRISDIDLTERNERYGLYSISLACSILAAIGAKLWASSFFFRLELALALAVALFLLITFFWKISGHTLVNSLGVLFVNSWFDRPLLELYFLIPLVSWSRYTLKKHTIAQLIGGVLLGLFVFLVYSLII